MSPQLMSDGTFKWLLTGLTAGLSTPWIFYDTFNLWRTRTLDPADPVVRDKRFGYAVGIVIGVIGTFGCLRFAGVF
jgi:hypothetical protein